MLIKVRSDEPDEPQAVAVRFEKLHVKGKGRRVNRVLGVVVVFLAVLLGANIWLVERARRPEIEPATAEEAVEVPGTDEAVASEAPEAVSEVAPGAAEEVSEVLEKPVVEPVEPVEPAGPANVAEAFEGLREYVVATGLDMAFGYVNLATGYTYTYQGERVYYGASLVKTLDAMYAYEKLPGFNWATEALITNAATYSKNDAHAELVEQFGMENLRAYGEEIGMKYHLKGSSIYETHYFCDTTVEDQIAEWRHLWYLVNNLENGYALGEYFRVGWWGVLGFYGHPEFMFKAGFYGPYYNETGIFLARSPYIFTLLTTNGYRADKDYIMAEMSRRVYEINEAFF